MRFSAPPTPASATATPVAQAAPAGQTTGAATATTGAATATTGAASGTTTTGGGDRDIDLDGVGLGGRFERVAVSCRLGGGPVVVARVVRCLVNPRGQVFSNVGCQACHTKTLTTEKSPLTGQSNVTIQPFSDFAVHEMGTGLADGVSQGSANGNEFRTAPLWGVGQRIFFLHDGRTKDLQEAIQQHASRGSEANTVINNYNLLSGTISSRS